MCTVHVYSYRGGWEPVLGRDVLQDLLRGVEGRESDHQQGDVPGGELTVDLDQDGGLGLVTAGKP